jgi:hypothetical protein
MVKTYKYEEVSMSLWAFEFPANYIRSSQGVAQSWQDEQRKNVLTEPEHAYHCSGMHYLRAAWERMSQSPVRSLIQWYSCHLYKILHQLEHLLQFIYFFWMDSFILSSSTGSSEAWSKLQLSRHTSNSDLNHIKVPSCKSMRTKSAV